MMNSVNDLISRQAAIDLFEKYRPHMAVSVCEYGEALKKISSAQPEQRWIPCAERLPETGQVVLWCNEHGSVFTSAITYRTDKYYSVGRHRGSIVAWMPLPEPYKQV